MNRSYFIWSNPAFAGQLLSMTSVERTAWMPIIDNEALSGGSNDH
jgi:hypothetical protein